MLVVIKAKEFYSILSLMVTGCRCPILHARANGSERQQVMPLIDRNLVKTNSPGRPRKRVKVLAADKGYDSKDLRKAIVNVVLDHSCQNESGKQKEIWADR